MVRGVHGEKIVAARDSDKLPCSDKKRLDDAISKYDQWVSELNKADKETTEDLIEYMVNSLNEYKLYVDIDLILIVQKISYIGKKDN